MAFLSSAQLFAIAAHAAVGQTRKYTGEPYHYHVEEVVDIMLEHSSVKVSPDMIEAAYLHDVLEDTKVTEALLKKLFAPEIVQLVVELTDVSKPEDGNRAARKKIDRDHLANASVDAKTIKLADLISNTRSIAQHAPGFARVYLEEKRLLLTEALTEGDSGLWSKAMETWEQAVRALEPKGD